MQYEQKPMTQTQENSQKGVLHILTASIREINQKTFLQPFSLDQQLKTIEMSFNIQNQQKLMVFSREIGQKP